MSDASVILIGAGPAASIAARALVRRGASVTVVAPDVRDGALRPSPNTLCAFADQVPEPLRDEVFSDVSLILSDDERIVFPAYAAIDRDALVAGLDVEAIAGRVTAALPDSVVLDDGRRLQADAVVDCSGGALAGRTATAFQTAVGVVLEGNHGLSAGTAHFMDWRDDDIADGPPTFVYALARRDGSLLLEETALCARPAVPLAVLEGRLHQRLAARGLSHLVVRDCEQVVIPLDLPATTGLIAFGVAGGFVHATTGFSIANALRTADPLADAIVEGVDAGLAGGALVDAVRRVVWTAERARLARLQRFALEAALALDHAELKALFRALFAASGALDFVKGTTTSAKAAAVLWRVFTDAPWRLRRHLVRGVPRAAADALHL